MATIEQEQSKVEQTAAEAESAADIDQLIRELDAASDHFPEQTLRACQKHHELVVPRLIDVLQDAARIGEDGTVREGNAPLYAIYLLTEFHIPEALPAIHGLLRLPDKVPETLLGDAITEDLPRVLATLATDPFEVLDSLIGNDDLNEYVRSAAIRAYQFLVRDQRMNRVSAVERLRGHLQNVIAEQQVYLTSCTVLALAELNGLEAKAEIDEAFEQQMVDEWFIGRRDIEEMLDPENPDSCTELDRLAPTNIADTVEELRHWHWPGDEKRRDTLRGIDIFPFTGGHTDSLHSLDADSTAERDYDHSFEPTIIRHEAPRVGRNDSCPCGSGKKYKKCCLRKSGNS